MKRGRKRRRSVALPAHKKQRGSFGVGKVAVSIALTGMSAAEQKRWQATKTRSYIAFAIGIAVGFGLILITLWRF